MLEQHWYSAGAHGDIVFTCFLAWNLQSCAVFERLDGSGYADYDWPSRASHSDGSHLDEGSDGSLLDEGVR